jgi:hypothetical protein
MWNKNNSGPANAHTLNRILRQQGFPVKVVSGKTYYYWLDHNNNIIEGSESVLVYRVSHLSLAHWLELAREATKAYYNPSDF